MEKPCQNVMKSQRFDFGWEMLIWLFACSMGNPTNNPEECDPTQCRCTAIEGHLRIENVSTASIQPNRSSKDGEGDVIPCVQQAKGVICSFTPTSSLVRASIWIEDKSFPVEIQAQKKTAEDCCQCEYYELTPNQLAIPYR